MKIENQIPITIISGFLGSGKTSLLTHILNSNHGKKIAVLVNDFGKLNIDAEQITKIEGETISLTNGCICCTIRDDLLTEVLRLCNKNTLPEHIIIETSGISDPTLVAHTFLMPAMQGVVEVDSIISLVDADQALEMDVEFKDLAKRQIKVADLILINKVDLVHKSKLQKIRKYVEATVDNTRIYETINGKAPLSLILNSETFDESKLERIGHSKNPEFQSWVYQNDNKFTFMALRKAIEHIPISIYRIKGFVHLESMPSKQGIFQMTGGRAWLRIGKVWSDKDRKTRLVFIGKKSEVNPMEINAHFDKCRIEYNREALDNSKPILVKNMKALSIVFG